MNVELIDDSGEIRATGFNQVGGLSSSTGSHCHRRSNSSSVCSASVRWWWPCLAVTAQTARLVQLDPTIAPSPPPPTDHHHSPTTTHHHTHTQLSLSHTHTHTHTPPHTTNPHTAARMLIVSVTFSSPARCTRFAVVVSRWPTRSGTRPTTRTRSRSGRRLWLRRFLIPPTLRWSSASKTVLASHLMLTHQQIQQENILYCPCSNPFNLQPHALTTPPPLSTLTTAMTTSSPPGFLS
jgi:hypothetical protein